MSLKTKHTISSGGGKAGTRSRAAMAKGRMSPSRKNERTIQPRLNKERVLQPPAKKTSGTDS